MYNNVIHIMIFTNSNDLERKIGQIVLNLERMVNYSKYIGILLTLVMVY